MCLIYSEADLFEYIYLFKIFSYVHIKTKAILIQVKNITTFFFT